MFEEQIASIKQQISHLPDRGVALYLLSALNQQLGDSGEALKLLKECVSLREGFDPVGSRNLGVKGLRDPVESQCFADYPYQYARTA
ncbi:hypothetical protein HDF16_005085 [Granulicella aggregans]|uniref:Tetratricopeptide repeat protein n=1 Tax=Granulicella aggregans TaxID=474949 RepID=A0A7W8E6H9_9BACT|nr:hypothetical protein [Granulicella aggregans]MBB5060349.1 hypothetical protein [Granulicella aggregans]